MEATVYSYSRLSAVEKCEVQYCLRYVDRVRVERGEGIEAFVGKCVHRVAEADHEGKLPPGVTGAWELFNDIFDADYSPSRVFDARNRGLEHWRGHGMKCVSNYMRIGRPDPGHKVLGVERKLGMPLLKSPLCSIIGILDRLVQVGDAFEVHDFKSGKPRSRDQFLADHQLPLYAQLVANEYEIPADVSMMVKRIYLSNGKIEPYLVTPARRGEALLWAQKAAILAQEVEDKYRESREAVANKTILCNWCGYKKRHCPAWQVGEGIV